MANVRSEDHRGPEVRSQKGQLGMADGSDSVTSAQPELFTVALETATETVGLRAVGLSGPESASILS